MKEEDTSSFKGDCNTHKHDLRRSATEDYAPISARISFRKTSSWEKRSSPAIAQRALAAPSGHTDARNNSTYGPIDPIMSKHEPTVYKGRGLLPCGSFIFLAEAPIPRVGRQPRADHRAIFAMNNRHAQIARYGAYDPDFGEADASFRRSKVAVTVPDWAEFSAGTKNPRGERKKKHLATPRKSGGRVRGWVK
jgi:hypothetical protein